MGNKQICGVFVICFTYFYVLASSSPIRKNSVSGGVNGEYGDGNVRNGIVHNRKFARGSGGGDHPSGSAESGNGNGNNNGQGGNKVIPAVVAGAANRHPNSHHSAASCNRNCIRFPVTVIITFYTLTVHLCGVFG